MRRATPRDLALLSTEEDRRHLDQEGHALAALMPALAVLRQRVSAEIKDDLGIAAARLLAERLFDARRARAAKAMRAEFGALCGRIASATHLEIREVRGLAQALLTGELDPRDAVCSCDG